MVYAFQLLYFPVPNGCGQYYTGNNGVIKGFNSEAPDNHKHYLSHLNYAVCVRIELGYCSVFFPYL